MQLLHSEKSVFKQGGLNVHYSRTLQHYAACSTMEFVHHQLNDLFTYYRYSKLIV